MDLQALNRQARQQFEGEAAEALTECEARERVIKKELEATKVCSLTLSVTLSPPLPHSLCYTFDTPPSLCVILSSHHFEPVAMFVYSSTRKSSPRICDTQLGLGAVPKKSRRIVLWVRCSSGEPRRHKGGLQARVSDRRHRGCPPQLITRRNQAAPRLHDLSYRTDP